MIETPAEFGPHIGRVHRVVAQSETAAGEIGLAVARRMEVLHLQRGIRRHAERSENRIAIGAFEPRAVALAVEVRGEPIADSDAVRRKPVIGEGERAQEISRTGAGDAIHADLEGVAAAAARPTAEAPAGAAAGERKAQD